MRQGEALALREAPALCGDQTGSTDRWTRPGPVFGHDETGTIENQSISFFRRICIKFCVNFGRWNLVRARAASQSVRAVARSSQYFENIL